MNHANNKLGDRITGNRKFCELTQAQLAELVGVSASYISKIESGNLGIPPSREVLERIGKAIHIEPLELFILAGSIDADKLREQALKDTNVACLLLMIENGTLSARALATFTTLARKLEGDE